MYQTFFQTKKQSGFSLVEAIIYVAIVSFLFSAIVYSSVEIMKTYKKAKSRGQIENSANVALDRMMREVRSATSVDTSASCLYDPPFAAGCDPEIGIIKLNKIVSGVPHTVRFYVVDGQVMVDEDDVLLGPITSKRTTIDALRLRRSATSTSETLKVELTISSTSFPEIVSDFYTTGVLRGSYN